VTELAKRELTGPGSQREDGHLQEMVWMKTAGVHDQPAGKMEFFA
jgi:hypothetical protein